MKSSFLSEVIISNDVGDLCPIYNYICVHFSAMQLLVSIVSAVMIQGCYVLDLVHDRALHM